MIVNALIATVALANIYGLFCRANLMDQSTYSDVRLAFSAQATSAFALALSAIAVPDLVQHATVAYITSVVWVQWVAARHWSHGQPHVFRRNQHGTGTR